jgi:hypothetical protein
MISLNPLGRLYRVARDLAILSLFVTLSAVAQGANNITGSANNKSRGKPADGDQVILLRLDHGVREEAHTRTGSKGEFNLAVQYPDRTYLVRVLHHGVAYDTPASAGDNLSIEVFDNALQVRGITGSIEIVRTGTNGSLLHVSDMYELWNRSSPPLTQTGERTFEVYLSPNAKIDSVLAAGPDKIGTLIHAALVPGDPGHYTVNFPLRPGATKFAFNYDVPYDGHAVFQTRRQYPLQELAIMIPPTMKFSSNSSAFEVLATRNTSYQVRAANQLREGEGPGFELSGSGALPALEGKAILPAHSLRQQAADLTASGQAQASLPSLSGSRGQTQPRSQSLTLVGLTFVLLITSALLVWRKSRA